MSLSDIESMRGGAFCLQSHCHGCGVSLRPLLKIFLYKFRLLWSLKLVPIIVVPLMRGVIWFILQYIGVFTGRTRLFDMTSDVKHFVCIPPFHTMIFKFYRSHRHGNTISVHAISAIHFCLNLSLYCICVCAWFLS